MTASRLTRLDVMLLSLSSKFTKYEPVQLETSGTVKLLPTLGVLWPSFFFFIVSFPQF